MSINIFANRLLLFLAGIVAVILGGTATLANFGINMFILPAFLYNPIITKFALLVGGAFLFFSAWSIKEMNATLDFSEVIIGLVLFLLAAFPLMMDYNLLWWSPITIKFVIPNLVMSIILLILGLYLLLRLYQIGKSKIFFG
ncbi:hypothetical protein COV16_00175 [Candidatus Woesearchaeota archaeon CG10_big_fil_rev_8_21_14_0_10_34_8]|jgi:hypothetical protein|nr:MAG: hypothetical protein COV16_00175 [Candidatus Woesearchaeota archaeon CG10_big_fil_rev_8_21_14_0_10_34_8]